MAEIKLLSWNVNGLRAVAKKGFLDRIWEIDPDIICLQEIKAKEEQLPSEVSIIPGYRSYFFPAQQGGYSGVAVYSKLEPELVTYGLDEGRFDDEGRVLVVDYADFRLLTAYFPNGSKNQERLDYKMDFCRCLTQYCQEFLRKEPDKLLLVCGDVNTAHQEIDLARPKENSQRSGFLPLERSWLDDFLAIGMVDTFRFFNSQGGQYTWWDLKTRARERNVGWRIDYFFASAAHQARVLNAGILPEISGSDHCPTSLTIKI